MTSLVLSYPFTFYLPSVGGEEGLDGSSFCLPQVNKCSHFFQLKNISFCGYHPKNNK